MSIRLDDTWSSAPTSLMEVVDYAFESAILLQDRFFSEDIDWIHAKQLLFQRRVFHSSEFQFRNVHGEDVSHGEVNSEESESSVEEPWHLSIEWQQEFEISYLRRSMANFEDLQDLLAEDDS